MGILDKHAVLEKNATLLLVGSLLVVTIGGIVEIAPLFYLENTIEDVEGVRPYSPLEMEGRNIYIREGCYVCHSQMIRPMRDEVERYGHYSLAAESKYDHPFQWGSKRTGPDLARVGGRYSDEWHVDHLRNPQSVVPESVMPKYGFLEAKLIEGTYIGDLMSTNRLVGVPYSDEMVANAAADLKAQVKPDGDASGLLARYPKAVVADFATTPHHVALDQAGDQVVVSAVLGWRAEQFAALAGAGADGTGRSPIERALVALISPALFPSERAFLSRNTFRLRYRDFDWRLNDLTGGRP